MHVLVKRLKPRQQIGYADSRSVMINHEGGGSDDKAGFSSLELWLFSLASSAAISMESYAEEKGWNLTFLQIEVEDEANEEGYLMDLKFYITAEGLTSDQRGEMFGAVRQECTLLRAVNPDIELYFADRLVEDGIEPAD
ncbi:OsmC family protein [Paenibacillus apiarius]|uniref:OsmC family protein n=1 Tax=Paenibacillus apiarius TaxID=46240 RepID=UPI00197FD0BA|nr:OsmC family protein [Paenibacillus apiarius]MBN3523994.1 OsmC family protein [Paenibacillus apiarius]